MADSRRRKRKKKKPEEKAPKKTFRERMLEHTPAAVDALSDKVNDKLGADPFDESAQLKMIEALLRFAQEAPFAYWCVLKLIRDRAKNGLEWMKMVRPGELDEGAFVQEAFLQTGLWRGLIELSEELSVEKLSRYRAALLGRRRTVSGPQTGVRNPDDRLQAAG